MISYSQLRISKKKFIKICQTIAIHLFPTLYQRYYPLFVLKGTVMQIDKALINDRSRFSKVSGKFHTPTICNFAVVCS